MPSLSLLFQPSIDNHKQNFKEKTCLFRMAMGEKGEELGTSGIQQMGIRLSVLEEGVTSGVTYLRKFFLVGTKSRVRRSFCRLFRPHYQRE